MTPRMVGVKPLYSVFTPSSWEIRTKTCMMLLYLFQGVETKQGSVGFKRKHKNPLVQVLGAHISLAVTAILARTVSSG